MLAMVVVGSVMVVVVGSEVAVEVAVVGSLVSSVVEVLLWFCGRSSGGRHSCNFSSSHGSGRNGFSCGAGRFSCSHGNGGSGFSCVSGSRNWFSR